MTRRTNARIAGFTFLIYIAVGLSSLAFPRTAPAAALLPVLTSFSALVLGVTLYAITREQDRELAMLALGRMIPVVLAWLGVASSALVVAFLPLQIVGYFGGLGSWQSPLTWYVWSPLLIFEVALAFWLIIKGVAEPAPRQAQ